MTIFTVTLTITKTFEVSSATSEEAVEYLENNLNTLPIISQYKTIGAIRK